VQLAVEGRCATCTGRLPRPSVPAVRSPGRLVTALLSIALLAAACSGDDDSGSVDADADTGADDAGAGLGSVADGLASLPEIEDPSDDQEVIVWGDLVQAAEIAGVDRPSDPTDEAQLRGYVQAVTGGPVDDESSPVVARTPEAAHVERLDVTGFADELGWSILDVDRFAERQTPPGRVTVLEGPFDEGQLTDALGEPDDGTWVVGSDEPFAQSFDEVSAARPLGESLWLTRSGDHLTVARSPQDSNAARQAVTGADGTATLADDEALAGLAAALDAESPYAAMLVRPGLTAVPAPSARTTPEQAEAQCAQALPEATAAVGTAVADDDGPLIVIALAHSSPAAAEANAEALERIATEGTSIANGQPWSEYVSVDDVSVTGDDVAVARLRPAEPSLASLWHSVVSQQDSLVGSC
jgi:hypothetical protein